jgi:hypothetical protein
MSNFIRIEPSTDIHLVLDPDFKDTFGNPLRNHMMRIWSAKPGLLPDASKGFEYSDISANCSFDFFPVAQNIVTIVGSELRPQNKGTVFMQVRFRDPDDNSLYHYLIVRIMVHNKMDTWWFGNEKLSVFRDNNIAHSQPTIYASFDDGEIIGDITGHDYVTLTSDDPLIVEISNDLNKPYRGRIRGIATGDRKITGSLAGKDLKLDVRVIELDISNGGNKILKRIMGDWTKPPRERHNILYIAEGFNDVHKYEEVYTKINESLFNSNRHSPYNILKDDFNVWAVFLPSQEEGITTGAQITTRGFPFPLFSADEPDEEKGKYTLRKLTEIVGVSDQDLKQRGITPANQSTKLKEVINALKVTWAADPAAQLLGFDAAKVNDEIARKWIIQTPLKLLAQTKDTFYGFIAGDRPGEKRSVKIEREKKDNNNVTIQKEEWVIPGNAEFRAVDFTRRIREWFNPNNDNFDFPPVVDHRRWAPDIYIYEDNSDAPWVGYFIDKHITQFDESDVPAIDPLFRVGSLWSPAFTPHANTNEVKSAGLVSILINSALNGRSANSVGKFVGGIIGKSNSYIETDGNVNENALKTKLDPDKTNKLSIEPAMRINFTDVTATIAHEFGHSFKLGDEYEEFKNNASVGDVHDSDNLVHFDDLSVNAVNPPGFPKAVDPEKIKWSVLHRPQHSIKTAQSFTITNSASITLKLTPGDIGILKKIKSDNLKLYLRRMIINLGNQKGRQLRFIAQDILDKDIFTELEIDGNINEATQEVTLKPTPQSNKGQFPTTDPDNIIPAGSILYVPKKSEGGNILSLVELEVMNFMKTTSYGSGVHVGRALSSNYNKNSTEPVEDNKLNDKNDKKDTPVSIPNFKGPCKDFTMIGIHEGGGTFVGKVYRPTGGCKMRNSRKDNEESEFCYVCKFLLVSRVNPSKLAKLDEQYPEAKERKWTRFLSIFGGINVSEIAK